MAHTRRHKKRRRTRGRFPGLYRVLSVVLILAALVAAAVIFFRVEHITVSGNGRYTAEEIIEVAGIDPGDNLFGVNKSAVAREILARLPYVQAVSVRRRLPNGIDITVQEGGAAATLALDGKWWVVDGAGKLLEEAAAQPPGLAVVTGVTPLAPAVGTYLAAEEAQAVRVDNLRALLTALEEHGLLEGTVSIDVTEEFEVRFLYDGRFYVAMSGGVKERFGYMIEQLSVGLRNPGVLENQPYDVRLGETECRFIPRQEKTS